MCCQFAQMSVFCMSQQLSFTSVVLNCVHLCRLKVQSVARAINPPKFFLPVCSTLKEWERALDDTAVVAGATTDGLPCLHHSTTYWFCSPMTHTGAPENGSPITTHEKGASTCLLFGCSAIVGDDALVMCRMWRRMAASGRYLYPLY